MTRNSPVNRRGVPTPIGEPTRGLFAAQFRPDLILAVALV